MHRHNPSWRHLRIALAACVGCMLALCFWQAPAQAASATVTASQPELSVAVGFGSLFVYRVGHWIPVQVTISDSQAAFHGTLSINTFRSSPSVNNPGQSNWHFEQAVTIPRGGEQHFTVYIPLVSGTAPAQGVFAQLRDDKGKTVATDIANTGYEIRPGSLLIGVLTDQGTRVNALELLTLPNQNILTSIPLNAETLPTISTTLDNFDILVLDDFDSARLSAAQLLALQSWVNRGGILIESGGSQWQQTLKPLPSSLLPVTINGTTTLTAGTQLVASNDPLAQTFDPQALTSTIPTDIAISQASQRADAVFSYNATILRYGQTPLLVQARQGQGIICYVALDMEDTGLANWSGERELWRLVLQHALGDNLLLTNSFESYHAGPGQLFTHSSLLYMTIPQSLPGPFILLGLIFVYALCLGLLRLLFMRKISSRWRWHIIAGLALVFSTCTYSLAFYLHNISIVDQSVALVQMNQNGASAHVTTYSGVFAPTSGDYTLHIPGQALAQPIAANYLTDDRLKGAKNDPPATVSTNATETSLQLKNMAQWSIRYTESEQDLQLHGGIVTHLTLKDNHLTGIISNMLTTSLDDLFLLMPQSFVPIGHLGAGSTLTIDAPFHTVSLYAGKNIADQIAAYSGLSEAYFPYLRDAYPQSDRERHVALLEALEGVGNVFTPCQNSCATHGVPDKETLYVTGGRVPNPNVNTYEPLLLKDAPATLIGWSAQPLSEDVTINGWRPLGQRESFVQMPLNPGMSGNLNAPPDFLTGRIVNLQSYDAELALSGVYAMTQGSMTFEFVLPANTAARTATMTIPDLWAHPFGPNTNISPNVSHMSVLLYNWQKGGWDSVILKQDSFSVGLQSYVNADGRLLVQVGNRDSTQGRLYFGRPALQLSP